MSNIASSDTISHKTWAAPLICGAHNTSSRGNPLPELKPTISNAPERGTSGAFALRYRQGVKAALTDGFDFSSMLPTPLEVMAIREALEAGLLGFPSHAVRAARDDGVTIEQVLNVVRVGIPI